MAKRTVDVLGTTMAVHDDGDGDAIVFLHGNPTSSFLWRGVVPHVADLGRCIVPDLIGMGDSAKIAGSSYRFVDHRRHLDALYDALDIGDRVTFVVHDWGSALGFDWANRHRERVEGIAYMEAIVRPVTWEEWPEASRRIFQAMRSPAGEEIVLEKNVFVERILPASVLEPLADDVMAEYRRPFAEPGEGRRPTLTWPREIPIDGEPGDVAEIVADYAAWLAEATVPKLFIDADPGAILVGEQRRFCEAWPAQTSVTVPGLHFVQEDSADAIGRALRAWYLTL